MEEEIGNVGNKKKPEVMKSIKKLGIHYNPGETIVASFKDKLDKKCKRMWKNIFFI